MTLLDRVLLGVVAVVLVVFAALLLATMAGNELVINWLQSQGLLFDGGILAAILLLLAAYLVFVAIRWKRVRFIVYSRELGAVKISADCVEDLIVEAALQTAGVQQVKAMITEVEAPKVRLKLRVSPDFNIPQISEELQESVKGYVEATVGVVIEEVEILVLGISKKSDADLDALL